MSSTGKFLQVDTYVAESIDFNLQSISQLDDELGAATVTLDGQMVSFVPTAAQRSLLQGLIKSSKSQYLFDASLQSDGLYKFRAASPCTPVVPRSNSRPPSSALVNVFPRVSTSTLSQGVFFMHLCFGHLPPAMCVYVAKHRLYDHLPEWFTPENIRKHWKPCRACYLAQMRILPTVVPRQPKAARLLSLTPLQLNDEFLSNPSYEDLYKASRCGEIIAIDKWGPYPHSTFSGIF